MGADAPAHPLRVATLGLVVAAAAVVEVGAAPGGKLTAASALVAAVPVALAALVARFARVPPGPRPPRWALPLLASLGALPFAAAPGLDALSLERPYEVQLLAGFAGVALGLAALGAVPGFLRLAAACSLFLALFGASLGDSQALLVALALYAAGGVGWLVFAYRAGLAAAPRGVAAVVGATGVARPVGRFPWGTAALVGVTAVLAAAVAAAGPRTALAAVWELVPTSGGTGEYDRRARGGVNDGDEETSGKNPVATGMVDTDCFLESPLPSLYDIADDMYGKPHKAKDQERSQALTAEVKQDHGRAADGLRPGRQFPVSRQSPPNPRKPLSRAARGLFEVAGPLPVHVRAAVFERFDGRVWVESPVPAPRPPDREGTTGWMNPPPVAADVFAADTVRHSVKVAKPTKGQAVAVARLDGTLVPAAPHVERFKVGMITDSTFFSTAADGIVRMVPRTLPDGVTVETDARVPDPVKLAAVAAWPVGEPDPTPHADRLAALAREWAGHLPRGWPQVEALAVRLRDEYVVDEGAAVPPDHPDAAAWFLFEARRGPDYLFATSAAALLRHLGYRTRLVAGFYADPEMLDPETGHTPVGPENVHIWPEIDAGGVWVVLEPTPGYAVMLPPQPWYSRAADTLAAAWRAALARPVLAVLVLLTVVALVRARRVLADVVAVARWRLRPGRDWRCWVCGAVHLLECRACRAGRPRPAGATPARHLAAVSDLAPLADLAGWAAYAPPGAAPDTPEEVWAACDRAVREWTYRRFARGTA